LVPWVKRIYPGEKYVLRWILHQLALKPPPAVGGIPIFGRLAAIFAGLEFCDFFAAKRPGYASR
jgi:hypothetical protein